ncbi:MAG: hypothetical protein AB8G22_06605 [Saprospiraceae bacterium]
MSTLMDKTSNKTDWMIFFGSTAVLVASLLFFPEWCWVPLPFVLTYLVKAFKVM